MPLLLFSKRRDHPDPSTHNTVSVYGTSDVQFHQTNYVWCRNLVTAWNRIWPQVLCNFLRLPWMMGPPPTGGVAVMTSPLAVSLPWPQQPMQQVPVTPTGVIVQPSTIQVSTAAGLLMPTGYGQPIPTSPTDGLTLPVSGLQAAITAGGLLAACPAVPIPVSAFLPQVSSIRMYYHHRFSLAKLEKVLV